MIFNPEDQVVFSYEPGKHLPGSLTIKNTGPSPLIFKFKVSSLNRFSIKPNPGLIKPGQQIVVAIFVHREIVQHLQSEQIQILYGVKQYSESKTFRMILQNGCKTDQLNLTMMVQEKENRVKLLESQMGNYKVAPFASESKKKSGGKLKIVLAGILGLLLGFFVPVQIFGQS